MAKNDRDDDDPWRRKRLRNEKDEEEAAAHQDSAMGKFLLESESGRKPGSLDPGTEKLLEYVKRAEPMVEQLNNLYNQYVSGAEKRPPIERRKQLDQLMATLMLMAKPTKSIQFKCNNLTHYYNIHKDRWDKLMKDLESGKLKRRGT